MKYNFVHNAKFYYNLYEKKREDNKLMSASVYLLEAIRLSRDLGYRIELASLYSEMGQYDMSNDECFYVLAKDPKNSECLNILSYNFTEKKNYRAAYFYFNKYDIYAPDDLIDVIAADTIVSDFNRLGFKLVYSNGKKDCSELKEEAELYLFMKQYKDAIQVLRQISENSPQYLSAQKILVYCYFMTEDYEQALMIANNLLERKENDISVMAVVYNIYAETGQIDSAKVTGDKILLSECYEVNDALKAGYCMMDAKRYNDAIELLNRERKKYPYNDNIMLLLACAYYMSNSISKAKNILLKLINMYGDRTYAKFYLESVNLGENCDGVITFSIPALRACKNNRIIEKADASFESFNKALVFDSKFKSILKWRIVSDSTDDYSQMLISKLGVMNNSASYKFLEELLINDRISGEAKVNALFQLFDYPLKKRAAIVYDSYFRIINLININETTDYMAEAYAMCAIYLSPMLKDYENEIYNSFMALNNRLKDNLKSMQSPEALAALILYQCNDLDISKDHNILTGLFGATLQTFRRYLKILENNII